MHLASDSDAKCIQMIKYYHIPQQHFKIYIHSRAQHLIKFKKYILLDVIINLFLSCEGIIYCDLFHGIAAYAQGPCVAILVLPIT